MVKKDNIKAVRVGAIFFKIHPNGEEEPDTHLFDMTEKSAKWWNDLETVFFDSDHLNLDHETLTKLKLAATRKYNKENSNG